MARNTTYIDQRFAKNLFTHSVIRNPIFSEYHPVMPHRVVPEWKTDMENRNLLVQNAELGHVPHFEHDESLFLRNREQTAYNVEDKIRVDHRLETLGRAELLHPPLHDTASRFNSSFIVRRRGKPNAVVE